MTNIIEIIADQTTRQSLDSEYEDQMLMDWVKSKTPDEFRLTTAYNGRYPAQSKIDKTTTVVKELPLGDNRLDAVVFWGMDEYQLVEVRSESTLEAGLIGELIVEYQTFIDQFSKRRGLYKLNPERVSTAVLTDGPAMAFRETVDKSPHRTDVNVDVYSAGEPSES